MKLYKNKILSSILTCLVSASAFAQTPATPTAQIPKVNYGPDFKGDTFEKIKSSGKILMGIRSSSIPISYYDANKKSIGYGTDVCWDIVEKIKEKLAMPDLTIEYVPVTSENREAIVKAGKVDIECGSTSNFATRRKNVDFTIPYYISSSRILTKNNSGIKSLNDLKNKKISVAAGTSAIAILKRLNDERNMSITIVVEKSFPDAFQAVESGKADAFVLLDFLLLGESIKSPNAKDYSLVGEPLSVEPVSIMIRKDEPKFKSFLDKEMMQIISSGKLSNYYTKWFETPIPVYNTNLNIPKSALFKDLLRMPTSITGS